MFNVMNENELMSVNGGFYYVPVYRMGGDGFFHYSGTTQVASNSGITKIYYIGSVRIEVH